MPPKIWIILMSVFAMSYPSLLAKFCMRKYVNGKWISKGDCGGPERMSGMQKELQFRANDEAKKWTVFQRRMNGDVDFYRSWGDYVKGFGNKEGDYWLGLDALHEMTKGGNMELQINMIGKDAGIYWVANYSNFQIGPGSDKYRLTVSGYSGNASRDGLTEYHNNRQFTTKDADNDDWTTGNCGTSYEGGWWYYNCGYSNLNGNFKETGRKGIQWFYGSNSGLVSFSEMKFRRRF